VGEDMEAVDGDDLKSDPETLGRSIEIAGVYFDDPVMEERFC
jgi:hypothetical protein